MIVCFSSYWLFVLLILFSLLQLCSQLAFNNSCAPEIFFNKSHRTSNQTQLFGARDDRTLMLNGKINHDWLSHVTRCSYKLHCCTHTLVQTISDSFGLFNFSTSFHSAVINSRYFYVHYVHSIIFDLCLVLTVSWNIALNRLKYFFILNYLKI